MARRRARPRGADRSAHHRDMDGGRCAPVLLHPPSRSMRSPCGRRVGVVSPTGAERAGCLARKEAALRPAPPARRGWGSRCGVCPAVSRAHGGSPRFDQRKRSMAMSDTRERGPAAVPGSVTPRYAHREARSARGRGASAPGCNAALQRVGTRFRVRGWDTLAVGVTRRYSGRGAPTGPAPRGLGLGCNAALRCARGLDQG